MNRILSGALALLFLAAPVAAQSHDVTTFGSLEISGAFSRATLPNAPVGAGYLTINNKGPADDILVAASSPVAGVTQIHHMQMEGDVMKMDQARHGVVIPAGRSVTLAPGGIHIMFMDLKQPLPEGSIVQVTLTFARAGSVEVELAVGPINADAPMHDMAGM